MSLPARPACGGSDGGGGSSNTVGSRPLSERRRRRIVFNALYASTMAVLAVADSAVLAPAASAASTKDTGSIGFPFAQACSATLTRAAAVGVGSAVLDSGEPVRPSGLDASVHNRARQIYSGYQWGQDIPCSNQDAEICYPRPIAMAPSAGAR